MSFTSPDFNSAVAKCCSSFQIFRRTDFLANFFPAIKFAKGTLQKLSQPKLEGEPSRPRQTKNYRAPTSAPATAPSPAALRSASARSVFSQVNPAPVRPKCPYAAVGL